MSSLGDIKFVPKGESLVLSDVLRSSYDTMFVNLGEHAGVIGKRFDGHYMFSSWNSELGPYTAVHDLANNKRPSDYYKPGKDMEIISYVLLNTTDIHNWPVYQELAGGKGWARKWSLLN